MNLFTGFTWNSPNGSTWNLMDLDGESDQLFTAQGVSGIGSAPRSVIADALPLGGTIVRTSLPQPRIITVPLTLGAGSVMDYTTTLRSLVESFTCTDRLGSGTFVVTRADGTSRQIPAIYYAGLEGSNDLGLAYGSLVVQLYCPDPFFTDSTPTVITFPPAQPRNFLGPYLTVISSQVLGNLTVEIDGSQPTFPTWMFTGPFSQAVCAGPNGSFTIARPAAVGEVYTVNTNPALTTAVSSDGTNLFPFINFPDASFFLLDPGSNALTVELDGDGPATFRGPLVRSAAGDGVSVLILVRNPDLSVAGSLNGWTTLSATLKFNAVGVYTITVPAFPLPAALVQRDAGIQIIRDGVQFMAGPIDSIGFARDGGQSDGNPGTLVITGASDLEYVANTLILPDPTSEVEDQGAADYYTRSDTVTPAAGGSAPAGQLMTDIVNLNCGPGATQVNPPRQIPGLIVNASTLGATISCQERFTPMADTLRTLALAGGGLGFDCVQVGRQLEFSVYQPRDLSAYARFSFELGNLRQVNWVQTFPLTTRAILGGSGTGSARTISQYVNADAETAWGRYVEEFVDDSSTSDPTQLAQDGAAELATNGEQDQLSATTVDAPTLRYGADAPGVIGYQLGDLVSVSPYAGVGLTDLVTQVTLTADGTSTGGELVTAVVGDGSTSSLPAYLRQIALLNQRMANLERT